MTGDLINATDAEKMGLINYARARGRTRRQGRRHGEEARRRRHEVDQIHQDGYQCRSQAASPIRCMDTCMAYEALTNRSQDHLEAINAFSEKRKPKFTGL